MTYQYLCEDCQQVIEEDFSIGKAAKTVKCLDCGNDCKRFYGEMSFILGGPAGQWPSKKARFNNEMSKRNEEAGRRMRKERTGTGPKLIDQS